VLHDARGDPSAHFPGAILRVQSPRLGTWTGVVGLGRVAPAAPMRPADRFRAGSIIKPFIAVVALQLAEERRLSLDARLPTLLPVNVVRRFHDSAQISVRMLLDHRSGIPEWDTPDIDDEIAHHPAKIWTIREKLDLAAAHPPVFAPGTSYKYSNTDYTLLGLIIERVTGHSWRHEVSRRVIAPLGLSGTSLPAPGHRSLPSPYAHAYAEVDGKRVDQTRVDPSVAGAAGGEALVTTVQDLARFRRAPPPPARDDRLSPQLGRRPIATACPGGEGARGDSSVRPANGARGPNSFPPHRHRPDRRRCVVKKKAAVGIRRDRQSPPGDSNPQPLHYKLPVCRAFALDTGD
jgi:D-alanyl-D-alanine carboxypeptidase